MRSSEFYDFYDFSYILSLMAVDVSRSSFPQSSFIASVTSEIIKNIEKFLSLELLADLNVDLNIFDYHFSRIFPLHE